MYEEDIRRGESPGLDAVSAAAAPHSAGDKSGTSPLQPGLGRMDSLRGKHASRSAEHLPLVPSPPSPSPSSSSTPISKARAVSGQHSRKDSVSRMRHASGDSASSLPRVATAAAQTAGATSKHRFRAGSFNVDATTASFSVLSTDPRTTTTTTAHFIDSSSPLVEEPVGDAPEIRVLSPTSPGQSGMRSPLEGPMGVSLSSSASSSSSSSVAVEAKSASPRRAAPPPPGKARRKPPAVPVRKGQLSPNGGPLSAIAASSQPNLTLSSGRASAY